MLKEKHKLPNGIAPSRTIVSENNEEEFVKLITSCQGKLFAYVVASLGNPDLAADVLQEVNLVAWRKSGEFEKGTNFDAWVFRIASFQVMAHRQRMIRDKVIFDQSLVDQIMRCSEQRSKFYDVRLARLNRCINKLPHRSREVILRRYSSGESLRSIAQNLMKTENAVGQLIFRIKKKLIACVAGDSQAREVDTDV